MKVVFRVDASVRMGTGHVMRCLTLAASLRERGVQIRFICRELSGNLIARLRQEALPVTVLPAPEMGNDTTFNEDYVAWLGVTQVEDAVQTIEALDGNEPDWLVVDHYGIDIEWEQRVRPHVGQVMVIDDLANRQHSCNVLLDQNYSLEGVRRYAGQVPDMCKLLLGPRYALLRPEYAAYRSLLRARQGVATRLLVFFGGSDPQNLTGMALEALSSSALKHISVDVVVGVNNPYRKSIEDQVLCRPLTTLHGARPHLADLMVQADLAIGAGGATTWERMCLGLPTVVVSNAENQRPTSEALAEIGLICYAGHFPDVTVDHLTQLLRSLIECPDKLVELAKQNRLQVDGVGALRLVEVLHPSSTSEIRLRPARIEDATLYCNWAKDSAVSENSISSLVIPRGIHQALFINELNNANSHLFVVEVADLAVGQIRFDRKDDEACIDYSIDPIAQGRGWDSRLVVMAAALMQQLEPVRLHAEAKTGNGVSSSMFLRMGFTETPSTFGKGRRCSIAVLSDQASWMNEYLCDLLLDWLTVGHRVQWVHDKKDLRPGDFCFYLSCAEIVPANILSQYRHNLVVHESDLPKGKGWSPLTWQILEGKNRIPVTLFEATEKVDSGVIYAQEWLEFKGHELVDELRKGQATATINLCKRFVNDYPQILEKARQQAGEESYYPRRRETDSELDPQQSIEAQFNLLRVVDNKLYPAIFYLNGQRYFLRVDRV